MRRKSAARKPAKRQQRKRAELLTAPAFCFLHLNQADKAKLSELIAGDNLDDPASLVEQIEEAVHGYLHPEAIVPTRTQSAEMARLFQQFALRANKDAAAALFVASRLDVDFGSPAQLETLADRARIHAERWEKADPSTPDPDLDGYGDLQQKSAKPLEDRSGNRFLAVVADVWEGHSGSPPSREKLAALAGVCWAAVGRPYTIGALESRARRVLADPDKFRPPSDTECFREPENDLERARANRL